MPNVKPDESRKKPFSASNANKSVYEVFDEVMTEAAEAGCPIGHKAIINALTTLTEYLPQFPAIQSISPTQHVTWCSKTLETELFVSLDDRGAKIRGDVKDIADEEDYRNAWTKCLWHIRRASGIGGSEIGTIVLNMSRDENGDFGSATNTVKEKLLMLAPQPGEKAMRRGHQMEDYVRTIHHRSSREVADDNSLETLRGFRSKEHPYIIGTPDDITLRSVGGKKERVLLDYKCPGEKVLEKYLKEGVPFGYVAQLHHYLIVAKDAGIKINSLQLVPFDYKGGAQTLIMKVNYDPLLEKEISDTAKLMWENYVLKGKVPAPRRQPELKVESIGLKDLMRKAGILNAVAGELHKRAEEAKEEAIMMADQTADHKAIGQINSGFYYITRKPVWDEETLIGLAATVGIDPDDYIFASASKVQGKNAAKMMRRLQEAVKTGDDQEIHNIINEDLDGATQFERDLDRLASDIHAAGVDCSFAYTIKETAGLTQKQKGPDAESKSIVMERAGVLVNEVVGVIDDRMLDFLHVEQEYVDEEPEGMSF